MYDFNPHFPCTMSSLLRFFGTRNTEAPENPETAESEKKSPWSKFDDLSLEEKRKLYKCGREYVTLKEIPTWLEYRKENLYAIYRKKGKRNEKPTSEVNEILNEKISLWQGDITTLEIDAIVNAANNSLLGGGGVDGCIHRAAGSTLRKECARLDGCSTGDAKITSGHKLPAKYVIHTVGPIGKQKKKLKSCYKKCLHLVKKYGLRTVAFCCVSTGIYGYPIYDASCVALNTIRKWLEYIDEDGNRNADLVDRIIICVFLGEDLDVYEQLLPRYFPSADTFDQGSAQEQDEDEEEKEHGSGKDKKEEQEAGKDKKEEHEAGKDKREEHEAGKEKMEAEHGSGKDKKEEHEAGKDKKEEHDSGQEKMEAEHGSEKDKKEEHEAGKDKKEEHEAGKDKKEEHDSGQEKMEAEHGSEKDKKEEHEAGKDKKEEHEAGKDKKEEHDSGQEKMEAEHGSEKDKKEEHEAGEDKKEEHDSGKEKLGADHDSRKDKKDERQSGEDEKGEHLKEGETKKEETEDIEMDDAAIKEGIPTPPKLEELVDSQEEVTNANLEEQVNQNLLPEAQNANTEEEPCDISME